MVGIGAISLVVERRSPKPLVRVRFLHRPHMELNTGNNENKVIPPSASQSFLDSELRPKIWDDYIGQESIKNNLKILLLAAKKRGHIPEHILFYGPPGLGKTTLAHLIAHETGRVLKITSGPAIERVADLASILTNLQVGDILFIDEIHRLNKMIEEVLYPALESGVLHIVIGKGPSARTVELNLSGFTLIAATTRISLMSAPLRSRFSGGVHHLEFYSDTEIAKILQNSAGKLGIDLESDAYLEIAKRSRKTPRTANYLLKRVRDYAEITHPDMPITSSIVREALDMIGIDQYGLSGTDRKLLDVLINNFKGGPVGIKTLSAGTGEEESTIEDVIEPYLIQTGFIEKTMRGRIALDKAYEHLGIEKPIN